MDNHPVQLVGKRLTVIGSIVPDPIGGDKKVSGYSRKISEWEGDDIRKRIVLQVGDIDLVEIVVVAEDITQFTQLTATCFDDETDPLTQSIFVQLRRSTALGMKMNGGRSVQSRNCISTVEPPLMYRILSHS